MAVMPGHAGSFKIGSNVVAELDNWTLDAGFGLEETQSFGDTAKERTPLISEWSGSASGRFDDTDTNGHVAIAAACLARTVLAVRFNIDSTNYYGGNAYVNMSLGASVNGVITVSYTFTGTGALTLT